MTAMLDQAAADPQQIIADLQRKLDARTAELQEKNERYTLVSQAVAEGIYDWDIARNALWVSPRLIEIFGWGEPGPDAGARPSQDWNARVHPDDFEHYRAALRAALKGEAARLHCEYRIRLSSSEYRWVEDHALPVRDERGWAVRLVGAVSDVTDRKQQEQELREALEQQTATAEVLQVINSSPGDLAPVFDAILDKAHALCGAERGTLFLYDGGKMKAVVAHGYPEDVVEHLRAGVDLAPHHAPLFAGNHVHIADLTQDGHPTGRIVSERGGVRTNLLVPLFRNGALLGMISCNRTEVRPFSDKEIALIENFAAQAVIAIANARLLGELRERTDELAARNSEFGERIEHQSATIDVLKVMSVSPGDPQPVFDLIVRRARDLCNTASATLFEFDGELVHFSSVVRDGSYGTPDTVEAYERLFPMVPTRGSIMCRAILDRQTIHVRDMASEPGVSAAVRNLGYKSQISLPLLRDGAAIGAVALTSAETGGFSDSQVALLQTFAEQAVIAITSAETYRELQQRTSDLQESLEYQTATSDVLKVISRSTADVQPVLDTVVETAARLCVADAATMLMREGGVYRYVAASAVDAEYWALLRQRTVVPGRGGVARRVALEGRVVHIADILADPDYAGSEAAKAGRRTQLGVPLLRDSEPIGIIMLSRKRVEPFTERQIELIRTFADQAVIAIENARLISETREALEKQTATAEILRVISGSPGDVQPTFDAIASRATILCGAASGGVFRFDGELIHFEAHYGWTPEELAAVRRVFPLAPGPGSVTARAIMTHEIAHSADIGDDLAYAQPSLARVGFHTVLSVPMLRHGRPLGAITVTRHQVEPFSEAQIDLLKTFADQAVIAIENVRLFTELRERTSDLQESLEYQTATSDVLKVISQSTFDVQPVFETILATAVRLCDSDIAIITNREGEAYRVAATVGGTLEWDAFMRGRLLPADRGSVNGRAALEGQVVHVHDLAADPEFTLTESVTIGKNRTSLGVPLLREGIVVGVICLGRMRVQPFTERQIELIRTFADQAAIALENARLLGELQQRTGDLQESLEYQTATSDVLKVISQSTFDLQLVLDTLSKTAAQLCDAEMAWLARREGEAYRFVTAVGSTAEFTTDAIRLKTRVLDPRSFVPGRQTITGRVASEARAVQIIDIAADPEYTLSELTTVAKIHTLLGVPLLRESVVVGTISLARQRVEPFTLKQIELVRTFADQAVIAIENARLITETQEALEQQTATAEVLQVINASPGDLAPVFETMLEKAMQLCGAAFGVLQNYDGRAWRTEAAHGVPPAYAEFRRNNPPAYSHPGTGPARLLAGERVVHIVDLKAEEAYSSGDPNRRALVNLGGARTSLHVALVRDERVCGCIQLYNNEVRPFSDKQIALLENFAAQAVIAMENARLLTETRQRTAELQESLEYQTATSDVLNVISRSTFDLSPVLEYVVETAIRLCRAHMGSIFRLEDGIYRWAVGYGLDPAYREIEERSPITPGTGTLVGRVALEGRALQIADALSDPDYAVKDEAQVTRARTMLGVPLLREGAPVGVIAMARDRVEPFSDKEIALVTTFADQAVIAIENARLLTEQREALEQQTATAEVLRVISGSATDLQPVFEAITARAAKLCEAEFSAVARFENGLLHLVAVSNLLPDEARAFHSLFPRAPTRGFVMGRAFVEGHTVHIEDVLADPDYDPRTREVLQSLTGYRSFFGVPILRDGKPIGVIGCARRAVKPFTAAQIELVSTFADQAVIAIENARLFNDLRDRTDELAQRQAELRVTFENMADGVVMFDEELRLAAWNRNFQEIIDLSDEFLADPRTYRDYIRLLAERGEFGAVDPEDEIRRYTESATRHTTVERTRPDGRVIEVRHNPVPSGGFVLIYADITERKRSEAEIRAARDAAEEASRTIEAAYQELKTAQARLIQAEKMASLGQLTAGIAHEIKNPLNFVNNFAGLSVELLDELKEAAAPALAALDGDKLAEVDEIVAMLTGNLEKIAEHGRRADGIVKSMLEHSRGESGERRSVDLNALVEEALNLAYHGARAQDQSFNITLERDFAAAVAPIELVPQDVTRVLLNLIGNGFYAAIKRQRDGAEPDFRPALKVTTRDLGEGVEIRVRDNGAGIMPEIRDKLFQPFFTTKPTGEGTGLGLSISYDIVTQQHGGTIAVDSRVGEFTEFAIHLPRARGTAPTATTIEAAAARMTA